MDELKTILLCLAKAVQRRIAPSHFILMLFAKALLQNQSIFHIQPFKETALIIPHDFLFEFLIQCEDLSCQHRLLFGLILIYSLFLNQFNFFKILLNLVHYWWFMVNLDVYRLFWEYWWLLVIFVGRLKILWLGSLIFLFVACSGSAILKDLVSFASLGQEASLPIISEFFGTLVEWGLNFLEIIANFVFIFG